MTREEAIHILANLKPTNTKSSFDAYVVGKAITMAIEALEQEPKTGHWITKIKSDLRGDMWPTNPKCSKCGREPYYSNTIYSYDFCPYCGCKMVEPQEISDRNLKMWEEIYAEEKRRERSEDDSTNVDK